ncbi:hypothetical protein GNX71_18585 [Variovorax sp. RKNM96]|uniref:hypothetical protein n=1 Tax=Variovorax sp. RKNM96 TaxID=2681552 RepID=UPI00197F35AC|nr:hypothetical protein [Variovorax sp. RKNM96]QSI31476.1 hypothetical protein GNX71_18585 [Variovorax sp. RKNM96]
MIELVPASSGHVMDLELRRQDLQEVTAWAPGRDPKDTIWQSLCRSTEAWAAIEDGKCIGIGGFSESKGAVHPWLMLSDRAASQPKAVLRTARWFIKRLQAASKGRVVCNYMDATNEGAKRLLGALGFTFLPAPGNGRFHFFFLPPTPSCA